MVKPICFTREHINKIRSGFSVDYSILERSIFAFALLEVLANTVECLVDKKSILIQSTWDFIFP